jgi:replicative DNA helicase
MSTLMSLPESEAVVIAEIIRSRGEYLDECGLTDEDFTVNEAGWAFAAMVRMQAKGEPIDAFSVGLREPRAEAWVLKIYDTPTYASHFHTHEVRQATVRRRLREVAATIMRDVTETEDPEGLIDSARARIDSANAGMMQPLTYVGDIIDEVIEQAGNPRLVYASPWASVTDTLGGGFRPGALYVLAARPGIGKSAVAMQIASALAEHGPVAFSSLEMPREEIVRRIIAQQNKMPHHLLESGKPLPDLWKARIDGWQQQAPRSMAIAMDDRASVTIADVRSFARSVRRPAGRIAGVVIDYLQLMGGPKGQSRYEIVSENSRLCKVMAMELHCPVIMLSQLNRNSENRIDRRPGLADLRDSGAIEQDADVVMMLSRDPNWEPPGPGMPPEPMPLDLDVLKNRHGPAGNHTLYWEGSQMRTYDATNTEW